MVEYWDRKFSIQMVGWPKKFSLDGLSLIIAFSFKGVIIPA